jgi:hypothetical protein
MKKPERRRGASFHERHLKKRVGHVYPVHHPSSFLSPASMLTPSAMSKGGKSERVQESRKERYEQY